MAKKWYEVSLAKSKIIRVYAENEYDAEEKAEEKTNPSWIVVTVREEM